MPPPQPPYPPLPPRQPEWFARNWMWFLPVTLLGVAAFAGAIYFGVMSFIGMMKTTDVYLGAVHYAKASPRVVAALGSPLDDGSLVHGNISVNGSAGNADYDIAISGPKDKAVIHAVAEKAGGVWTFTTLVVEVNGTGEKIDLNSGPQPLTAPSR